MPLNIDLVRERLPGRRIDWHKSLASTMPEAARLAAEGCDHGTAVVVEEQTAGIGRKGNTWHSEAQSGLYVSVVLRLGVTGDLLPVVMLALGIASREAVIQATGLAPDLRWPNDLMIRDRKCGGILAQLSDDAIVAGIGINVNHAGFPPEIAPLATSLRIAAGRELSREDLLIALLPAIDRSCTILTQEGGEAILRIFEHASSYACGRRVRVQQEGSDLVGTTAGLTKAGFLTLREDNGRETVILAGGLRPLIPIP